MRYANHALVALVWEIFLSSAKAVWFRSIATWLVLGWVTLAGVTLAQEIQRESYIYSDNLPPRDGCQLAEQALKRQAVARQCGSRLTGGAARFKSETVDDLFRLHFETVGGRVTGYEGKVINPAEPMIETGTTLLRCTVEAKVTVQCDQGSRDPAFIPTPEIHVKLNETVFREGEAMKIGIHLPPDMPGTAHVAIVQLLPYWADEKRVWRIYPNAFQTVHTLNGGDRLDLPTAAYMLELTLPKRRSSVEEVLMVVFSRQPLALPETMTIEQFHRVLGEVPLNQRREVVLGYRIEAQGPRSSR